MEKTYIAIDLKSFYASVECVERGLDPLRANLVVADPRRTEKTICLAVSPSLKAYGIPGRARLFEVVQRVREINRERLKKAPNHTFTDKSVYDPSLKLYPQLELDYIVAPPRMARYMEVSLRVLKTYLKYVAREDIHVYSIDEVFMDVTGYLKAKGLTAREFAMEIILDVLSETGITATAGIGPNLYLCKVAMDIQAKHIPADKNGVRIAELDCLTYRKLFWGHRPLTDFWRVGEGYAAKLASVGLHTMGDIARCSIGKKGAFYSEDLLYRLFGVSAELLIDHAWGYEPTTLADIKAYRPKACSLSSGQVLHTPYPRDKARLVVQEMTDLLVLDLVEKGLVTNQLTLTIGYDIENLTDPRRRAGYTGEIITDRYGRAAPKSAHGSENAPCYTSSGRLLIALIGRLFDRIADSALLVRRLTVVANNVIAEADIPPCDEQLDFFSATREAQALQEQEKNMRIKERRQQEALLSIKKKFGKNAIIKGMNLQEGATAIDRNTQIGGHKA